MAMASISTSCYNPVLPSGFVERGFWSETSQAEASSSNRSQEDGRVCLQSAQQKSCLAGPVQILRRQTSDHEAPSSPISSSFPRPGSSSPVDGDWKSPGRSLSSRRRSSGHGAMEATEALRVCKGLDTTTDAGCHGESRTDSQTHFTEWKEYSYHETATSRGASGGVPVFVMLPLDSVTMNNTVKRRRALNASLLALKSAGVEGVMMDVWWGIVEKDGPRNYNWSAYKEIIEIVRKSGLKVQAVMSFHQCGANVGDSCTIPLPPWVTEEMQRNPDIAYTDKAGRRNQEYVSLGCDTLPVLKGRTPIQVYADFMRSFRDTFKHLLGDVIAEIQCGMGPAGELRYPSYPESEGKWRFPGIGEFQCYDKYMMASLRASAHSQGKPHWGFGGPHDAGYYNQMPEETGFFQRDGSWQSEYGQFFLEWYSQMLIAHGEGVLAAAAGIFCGTGVTISGKVAGIHWHYGTRSHAAELTAGYYNTWSRDGYLPIAQMFAKHSVTLNFTCIEMRDVEQPAQALCSPEHLVRQVALASRKAGVRMAGENALPRFDEGAHHQIVQKSRLQMSEKGDNTATHEELEPLSAFTFLRMGESLFRSENWSLFVPFVRHMEEGRTFHPWEEEARTVEIRVHATRPLVQEAASFMYH